jgi:hypothetical protein
MKKYGLACIVLMAFACNMQTKHDNPQAGTKTNQSVTYRLRTNPVPGSTWYYDISNESETNMEIAGKEINSINKTTAGVSYTIDKDSTGNFLLTMRYDKIHLYTQNGETETNMDAASASASADPLEKLLGKLKEATITATISPNGKTLGVKGYKELADNMMAAIHFTDDYTRSVAKSRLDQVIGEGLIKKNIDQLFSLFPDSAVSVGDTWQLTTHEKAELSLVVKTNYVLTKIKDGIAVITAEGDMVNDNNTATVMGNSVKTDLTGTQEGEYKVETQTGMLTSGEITAKVKGTLHLVDREVPVRIKSTVTIKGRKIQK